MISQYFKETCDNEIYGDIENIEEHFICDWSLQAAAFISANKMKGIFNSSFPMSYCHWRQTT